MQLERPHERSIAPVSQRRYNQPAGVSQVLVSIWYFSCYHLDYNYAVVEIVAELADPVKIGWRADLVSCKLGHNVTSYKKVMHVYKICSGSNNSKKCFLGGVGVAKGGRGRLSMLNI